MSKLCSTVCIRQHDLFYRLPVACSARIAHSRDTRVVEGIFDDYCMCRNSTAERSVTSDPATMATTPKTLCSLLLIRCLIFTFVAGEENHEGRRVVIVGASYEIEKICGRLACSQSRRSCRVRSRVTPQVFYTSQSRIVQTVMVSSWMHPAGLESKKE